VPVGSQKNNHAASRRVLQIIAEWRRTLGQVCDEPVALARNKRRETACSNFEELTAEECPGFAYTLQQRYFLGTPCARLAAVTTAPETHRNANSATTPSMTYATISCLSIPAANWSRARRLPILETMESAENKRLQTLA
jgi:hypothetical protein